MTRFANVPFLDTVTRPSDFAVRRLLVRLIAPLSPPRRISLSGVAPAITATSCGDRPSCEPSIKE